MNVVCGIIIIPCEHEHAQSYIELYGMTWPLKMICVKNKCQSRSINRLFFLLFFTESKKGFSSEKFHFILIVKLNTYSFMNLNGFSFK